jgi:hypothetical protein
MQDVSESTISYAQHIGPLFRERDIDSMRRANLDLASYADVAARADQILEKLEAGVMPCDGAWPAEQVDLFRRWMDQGKQA